MPTLGSGAISVGTAGETWVSMRHGSHKLDERFLIRQRVLDCGHRIIDRVAVGSRSRRIAIGTGLIICGDGERRRMIRLRVLLKFGNDFMAAITTQTNGEVLVVGFTDSKILDSQRIEQVGKELQECVPQAIHKKLLLNFRGVSFMSSAMITKLVMLNKGMQGTGCQL